MILQQLLACSVCFLLEKLITSSAIKFVISFCIIINRFNELSHPVDANFKASSFHWPFILFGHKIRKLKSSNISSLLALLRASVCGSENSSIFQRESFLPRKQQKVFCICEATKTKQQSVFHFFFNLQLLSYQIICLFLGQTRANSRRASTNEFTSWSSENFPRHSPAELPPRVCLKHQQILYNLSLLGASWA